MTTAQVHPQHLRDFCYAVLADAGLAEPANVALSEHLLLANLMGVDSHGLQQLPGYVRSLNSGRIRADAEPRLETSAATAILHVDANGAAGHYAALRATEWLIERAQETGIAIAAVRNSNHFGMAGYYTRLLAAANMVGFASSDTNVADLAPFGGREARIGNNPISWALPTGDDCPVVLDAAVGSVSGGKIKHFAYLGLPLSDKWGLDANAVPSDRAAAVVLNTADSYKASAMGLISDLLCGPLLGTASSFFKDKAKHNAANATGHLLLALNISHFTALDAFTAETRRAALAYQNTPRLDATTPLYYPGQLEVHTQRQRRVEGIPVPIALLDSFRHHFDAAQLALLQA